MNLTRITDPTEAAVKHYLDSLAVLSWEQSLGAHQVSPGNVRLLDIGTGAGFPAVPLAIMRPEWRIVALDGTRKKIEFVRRVSKELNLNNLTAEHGHSDHWITHEFYCLVTTRAVGSLAEVILAGRRFIQSKGRIVAYKTAKLPDEELAQARDAARRLQMRMEEPFLYELRCGQDVLERALYTVRAA